MDVYNSEFVDFHLFKNISATSLKILSIMALELLTSSIYGTLTTYTALQIHRKVNAPYMDEIFHVPQAQRFCAGNFTEVK